MNSIRIREAAPAKVNLFLHVVGRRADGYHLLESLVAFADVGDLVEVVATPVEAAIRQGRGLVARGPFAPALQAALPPGGRLSVETACDIACEAARPRRFALELELEKNLPVAAGLGGGTADGAAALRALDQAMGLEWGEAERAAAALRLGADGPVCMAGRVAMMRGIGETIAPLEAWPALDVVLANPLRPTETRAVFSSHASRAAEFSVSYPAPPPAPDVEGAIAYLAGARNDLFEAACAVEPDVAETAHALAALPGARLVRLSGSGATCWAAFADAGAARRAAAALQAEQPDWWVAATRLGGAP